MSFNLRNIFTEFHNKKFSNKNITFVPKKNTKDMKKKINMKKKENIKDDKKNNRIYNGMKIKIFEVDNLEDFDFDILEINDIESLLKMPESNKIKETKKIMELDSIAVTQKFTDLIHIPQDYFMLIFQQSKGIVYKGIKKYRYTLQLYDGLTPIIAVEYDKNKQILYYMKLAQQQNVLEWFDVYTKIPRYIDNITIIYNLFDLPEIVYLKKFTIYCNKFTYAQVYDYQDNNYIQIIPYYENVDYDDEGNSFDHYEVNIVLNLITYINDKNMVDIYTNEQNKEKDLIIYKPFYLLVMTPYVKIKYQKKMNTIIQYYTRMQKNKMNNQIK